MEHTINPDGTLPCLICGGTSEAHQRLELASGQRIPCPWVDDDGMPDVWASREQYAAHVWVAGVTANQREQFLRDACLETEFDPALVGELVELLACPRAGRPFGQSFPVVQFTDELSGVVVEVQA